jgi:hypothetical protein
LARALRRPPLILALPALVGLSTLLHWLAGREVAGPWIMPDEAIYGVRALGLWQHGRLPLFGQSGAGYSVLYPVLAGGPLSLGSLPTGYALLKPVQALVMSLAAVPLYAYTRPRAGVLRALLAAALTLAAPLVLFSGYVMTEVLYYPLAAAALFCSARAIATTSYRDQAIAVVLIAAAVATRVQGIVLLPVFAGAVLLDSALERRADRLRRFWPLWVLLLAGAAVVAALPRVLGAYESTVTGGYDVGPALRLVFHHLAYLIVIVGVVPVAALVLSFVAEIRGGGDDPHGRALTSVAVCATVLTVLQVGVFASRYAPHLLERDLAALPPLYFGVFALWLGRGAPRPWLAASATAFALLAIVVLAPWNQMVNWDAFPDSPGISLLLASPGGWRPLAAVSVVAGVLLVLFRFAPFVEAAGLVVLGLLVWTSVKAADLVRPYAAGAQSVLAGTPRNWIDRTVDGSVAYVYNGDLAGGPVVWAQRFWNPRIDRVVSLAPHVVSGPIPQVEVRPKIFGDLPFDDPYAVTNDRTTLRGEAIAHQDRGPNQYGLTLWRVTRPARLATTIQGVQPNGDMTGPANVTVYGCAGGSLHLTLLPKSTSRLEIDLDGRPVVSTDISNRASWSTSLPVPPSRGPFPCLFTIRGGPLLGSTLIEFAYPS